MYLRAVIIIVSSGSDQEISVSYRFMHDRVRQAAYSLVGVSEKPDLHLRIGRLLLKKIRYPTDFQRVITLADDELLHWNETHQASTAAVSSSLSSAPTASQSSEPTNDGNEEIQNNDKDSSLLMDVVSHLNRGQLIVTDSSERWKYAELNCYLAHCTRESTAFGPALTMALYGLIFMAPPQPLSNDTLDTKVTTVSGSIPTSENKRHDIDEEEEDHDVDDTNYDNSRKMSSPDSTSSVDEQSMVEDDTLLQPSNMDYDELIPSSVWHDSHRQLVGTRLYSLRLALEYAVSNISGADVWAKVAVARTTRPMDKARLLSIQSISMIFRSNLQAAIDLGLQALEVLGHAMPPADQWGPHAGANFGVRSLLSQAI
jgi:hypothetical protein